MKQGECSVKEKTLAGSPDSWFSCFPEIDRVTHTTVHLTRKRPPPDLLRPPPGPQTCGPEAFHCQQGGCIAKDRVCDGTADCRAGEDEAIADCGEHRGGGQLGRGAGWLSAVWPGGPRDAGRERPPEAGSAALQTAARVLRGRGGGEGSTGVLLLPLQFSPEDPECDLVVLLQLTAEACGFS